MNKWEELEQAVADVSAGRFEVLQFEVLQD